ncbi:hypothetical protein HBH56_111840 [Parastagonospora nodorum]|uniref:Uncharacterized protein n=1 Tax=Phaeosphaeria nodorum (strain SN15 / ATCC MYA-4574 / FGSC 10173) TaxID=321614 RepID=A0A7U2I6C9_PHANO|nr:hypothetical protein HBH56_111840 [Parastagonospora nodorum]QRD03455.1 hypothetical protein JI435_419550 [Parastagonospora nodorum SN15]KAH3950968.1 hypothetical protein HBH53_067530 [Parastagonospora nodorum]KAH3999635.1 hypothetical protein HBI10_114810 [Parastagonospora nodorum]KAH4013185.1 hypothetical protein HBI13_180860 [Parastagonospora nodorum]
MCLGFSRKLSRKRRNEKAPLIVQNSRIRYRDEQRLRSFLSGLFPDGNFKVKMKEDQWILYVPRRLTEVYFPKLNLENIH